MHSILRAVRASLLITLGAGAAGAQQLRGTLDIGSSSVRYADSVDVTAVTMSPAFTAIFANVSLGGFGTLSQASGASTYSGTVHGALSSSGGRRASVELGGSTGGSAHSDGARTGQMMGTGRAYLNASRGGAWAGAGLGGTWDGVVWRDLVQGSLGGWLSGTAGSAVASLAPTVVDDTIAYSDALLTLQRPNGRLELSATLGTRIGEPVPSLLTDRVWGSVSATAWIRPSVGIVISGGTYPIDFTQGYPGGRFVSVALRFAAERRSGGMPLAPLVSPTSTEVRAFELAPGTAGAQRIRVHAPDARSVEISGDFTNWAPVALTPAGNGWWSASPPMSAGTHEITVRVNGGAWTVPPGLAAIRDEFGGSVGLLVVR
jgi:hypothetical protein